MTGTVLITGASSGFGLLTTVTLARRGWRVLATMCDLNRREKLEDAARAVGVLEQIEFHERPKLRYVVGTDARIAMLLRKVLPWSTFERLIAKTMGMDQ